MLGRVDSGAIGAQGDSPAPGALLPVTLDGTLPGIRRTTVTATTKATGGDTARLDALMVQPLVSRLVLGGDGHGTALLRSAAHVRHPHERRGARQRDGARSRRTTAVGRLLVPHEQQRPPSYP